MASTDATPIPVKNQAYRVTFPILDADGDLVTAATGLDSEVSKDGGTFADCTNEATEIATGSGMYFLDITATEMNADTVAIIVKTTSSGAKTTPMVLYPNKAGGLAVNVTSWAGSATATGNIAIKNTLVHGTDITGTPADSAGVTTLLSRVTSTIFSGITSLKEWLGMLAGKQTGNSTARTEIRSSGAGSGTYDETTDSQEAIRDRGDASWITGAGGDPWSTLIPGSYGAGTAGNILGNRLDAAVSTRSTYAGADTAGTTTLLSRIASALTITAGKVDVNDKTGFSLVSAYDPAKTAATQASVNTIDDFVDTEVGAIKVVTDKLDTALELDGAVYRYTTNALEQAPTGGAATDPWNTALPGAYAAGTAGKILGTNLDVAVSTRATQTSVDGVSAKTVNLPSDPADASDIAAQFATVNGTLATLSSYVDTEVAAIKAKTDNLPIDPADASDILASFTLVNTKLDTIDDFVDTEVAAIKAKTDQLVFTGGKVDANATTAITPTDLNAIADALLKRDWTALTGEAQYSALNAFRMLRNVWNTSSGTLTVKKEDGATTAWTRTLTVDPTAQPIVAAT